METLGWILLSAAISHLVIPPSLYRHNYTIVLPNSNWTLRKGLFMICCWCSRSMTRVLLIGLDGATWDLLKPWADDGSLPMLAKLMDKGCWGGLESTIPPITIPAWISLATGLNPGKIGAYDFLSRKGNDYRLYPTSSATFRGRAIWDHIAADGNRKIGVVNYPGLSPVYKINGFMVPNTSFDEIEVGCFPQALKRELDQVCHGYEGSVAYHDTKYDDTELFVTDLHRVLSKQLAAAHYLLNQPWDLFVYVLSASDWAQHLMWKYIDASHPLYDHKESKKYGAELLRFWQRVDDFLGQVIEAHKGANLLLVSDHGFGSQDECFSLGKWLEMKGYLTKKSTRRREICTSMRNVTLSVLRSLYYKSRLGRAIPDSLLRQVGRALTTDFLDQLDFGQSRAYVLGHTIPFGAIYINREGRDAQGCVKQDEYEALKSEIVGSLRNLKSDIGKDVQVEVFDTKGIYWGPYVQHAPDIIFTIDDWRCVVNEQRFDDALFKDEPYSNRHTGSHRMNGIFLAYGPDIRNTREELNGLKIYDIAPTLLHMFGVPIPRDVDGRVLREVFKETSEIAHRPIKYQMQVEGEKVKAKIKELKAKKRL